jgi:hypothetical protein
LDSTGFPIITPFSGDWSSWAEYRYRSDDSTYVYYDLWNTGAANGGGFSYDENDNTNNDGGYQIRVSKTTGDWSDYPHTGSHPPTGVSTTNGNVALGTLFTFVKPSGTGQTPWMSDPNTSTPTYPNTLDVAGGNWGATTFTLQSASTTDEIIYWKADDTAGTTAIYYKVSESKWYDGSSGGQPTAFSINDGTPSDPSAVVSEGDSVKLTAGSSGNYGSFTMFSTSSSSTPTFTNFPSTIAFTGWWNDQFNRHYQLTTSTDTFIQYELYDANGLVGAEYGSTFTSTPSGILFNVEDVGDSSTPFSYSNGSTFVGTSGIVQAGDSLTLWTNATGTGTAEAVLTVPDFFYEAPSVPDIQPIVNTGGSWNGVHSWASPTTETINGSVEYHYSLTFGTSRIAYRTIDKTWYDADTSSQPSALSSDAFSTQSLALVNPQYVWIGDTSATNTDFYISFDNPYYEA